MNANEKTSHDDSGQLVPTEKASSVQTGPGCVMGDSMLHSGVQRIISFSEIAGGTTEVIIEHEGQKYRLRATRNGRLLLNK